MGRLILVLSLIWVSSSFGKTLTCEEHCQQFDSFTHDCNYRTRCTTIDERLHYTYCEKFDSFTNKCASEANLITPYTVNPYLPAPGCEEKCQYFDDFSGECLYRTKCQFQQAFTLFTACEQWDDFFNKCLSEAVTWSVNIY